MLLELMRTPLRATLALLSLLALVASAGCQRGEDVDRHEFSVRGAAERQLGAPAEPGAGLTRVDGEFRLDGQRISPFGLRAANALQADVVTDRLIDALPDLKAHGIQSIAVTIQGGRHTGGGNSAFNGFTPEGHLTTSARARLEKLLNAARSQDMVPVVMLFYRGQDQELEDERAVRASVRETVDFVRPWRNLWIHMINEPGHHGYDQRILTSTPGQEELHKLAKQIDSQRIVYVSNATRANDGFRSDTWGRIPGLDPPSAGDVAIEFLRFDEYEEPGVFTREERQRTIEAIRRTAESGGYLFYHSAWHQKADAPEWPQFDKGGRGTASSPGVSFAWDEMRLLHGSRGEKAK